MRFFCSTIVPHYRRAHFPHRAHFSRRTPSQVRQCLYYYSSNLMSTILKSGIARDLHDKDAIRLMARIADSVPLFVLRNNETCLISRRDVFCVVYTYLRLDFNDPYIPLDIFNGIRKDLELLRGLFCSRELSFGLFAYKWDSDTPR